MARTRALMAARVRPSMVIVAALAALACARGAAAQQEQAPTYAEVRADAIGGNGATAQAGAGVVVPMGIYVRVGLDAAAGSTWRDGVARASGRIDGIARFLLDPFREVPVGLSVGGGASLPYRSGDTHVRPYLTAVVDIEGRMRGGVTPAVEFGLGGGARLGLVLRTSPPRWR